MKCKKLLRYLFCLSFSLLLLLPAGAMAADYPDLSESHWAYTEMDEAIALGIIKGYEDGRIAPEDTLTWGQYLTMLERAFYPEDYAENDAVVTAEALPWYLSGYCAAQASGLLLEDDFLNVEESLLETPILRQDAVVLLERVLPEGASGYRYSSTAGETFSDWNELSANHQSALNRLYDLYVVNGRDDGTFGGNETIKRCDGSVLLLRILQQVDRARYGETMEVTLHLVDQNGNPLDKQTVEGHIGSWTLNLADTNALQGYTYSSGSQSVSSVCREYTLVFRPLTKAELAQEEFWDKADRGEADWDDYYSQDFWLWFQGESDRKHLLLFGDENKRRFADKAEAEANMTTVSFPVWKLDSSGNKVSSTASLSIHAALADEVVAIFTEIYNDPEQFPIKDIGGYGWRGDSATGEHNCGTAIDINWNENYQIREGKIEAGSLWQPGTNAYSIDPNGSVVRIFAEHGWSWGGDAWAYSSDDREGYHDYMHFSYMGK